MDTMIQITASGFETMRPFFTHISEKQLAFVVNKGGLDHCADLVFSHHLQCMRGWKISMDDAVACPGAWVIADRLSQSIHRNSLGAVTTTMDSDIPTQFFGEREISAQADDIQAAKIPDRAFA